MIKMSFFNGTLDRKKAIETIVNSNKPCLYTLGFKFKDPTTKNVPISKEDAIKIVSTESLLDITEYEDKFDLNAYTSNDMW